MPRPSPTLLLALARGARRCSHAAWETLVASASPSSSMGSCGAWNGAARAPTSSWATAARSASLSTSSTASTSASSSSSSSSNDDDGHLHLGRAARPTDQAHVNALLYRARQRGFLELDLLLGGWAARHASGLDARGRADLAELLELENPDLFAWLTGQARAPPEVSANAAFRSIAADVAERLHRHRPAEAKSREGAKWVRGWDDVKKESRGEK